MQENKKIHIHLDSQDFQGFLWVLGQVLIAGIGISWLLKLDAGIGLLFSSIIFITYFFYKIAKMKETFLLEIIETLETQNEKLEKLNALLLNQAKQTHTKTDI